MATKPIGIVDWVDRFIRRVSRWLRPRRKQRGPEILRELSSPWCRLLLLKRHDPAAVRTWRAIPKYESDSDWLISLDHLRRVPGAPRVARMHPLASHRIAVVRISRFQQLAPGSGSFPVFVGDFNLCPVGGLSDDDRSAIAIFDAVCKSLLTDLAERIDWRSQVEEQAQKYLGASHIAYHKPEWEA